MYQFWSHKSGEIFAVALENNTPVLVSEALHHTEVRDGDGVLADPSEFNFDNTFDDNVDDYRLIEE